VLQDSLLEFGMSQKKPVELPGTVSGLRRLGRNNGRYLGETIDIEATLGAIEALSRERGWEGDCFFKSDSFSLRGYHLAASDCRKSIYLSAGIHGDEPAGPLAVLDLVREHRWPETVDVWVCPCLNPSGFPLNSRENARGVDLNRQYLQPTAQETLAHVAWLQQRPSFDVSLSLHEDWEAQGFYVYELGLDGQPSYAEEIVRRVAEVCPIDVSPVIEGREAHQGVIRPSVDLAARPQWPEAFYLISHKTRVSCTLEAPSDFPLTTRVAALVAGVRTVLDALAEG
jgi:murein peptide amidase A